MFHWTDWVIILLIDFKTVIRVFEMFKFLIWRAVKLTLQWTNYVSANETAVLYYYVVYLLIICVKCAYILAYYGGGHFKAGHHEWKHWQKVDFITN